MIFLTAPLAIVVAVLGFLFLSEPAALPVEDFTRWINDPDHGMVKDVYVNGLHISIKHLPTDYLVRSEVSKILHTNKEFPLTSSTIDSIRGLYTESMTFVLGIGPDERKEKGGDVMFRDITSYPEFVQRAMNLNFEMDKFVSMRVGSSQYAPVLTNLENTYGLNTARSIVLVFPRPPDVPDGEEAGYEVVWNDMLYTTGIHRFFFSARDMESIPALSFEKFL